jgi:glucose-6-phosphate 1-dehydrogenase
LQFEAKLPDSDQEMLPVDMDFHYRDSFHENLPDAYERLLLEAMEGDASLFTRSDMIEAAWRLIDPVLTGWEEENQPHLAFYPSGSWGPEEADTLLDKDGRKWRLGCNLDDPSH